VFNRTSAGCESVGALHLALSSSVPFVSRQSSLHNAIPLCADCVCSYLYSRQPDNIKAKFLAWNSLLRTRLFRYTHISIRKLTEQKRIHESHLLDKYVYRMSAWNQSAPFSISLLSTLALKTQAGWGLMFFVRHKLVCHYLYLILLCRTISVFAQLRFNLPASVCWQQYYLPHIIMPLSLLLVTSSRHVRSHLLFPLIIACFLSRTAAAILERWQ